MSFNLESDNKPVKSLKPQQRRTKRTHKNFWKVKLLVQVVAALIRKGNTFLICQRPAHKMRGLLWEFVGGKIEPGETKEQALIRECREELDVEISVSDVFMQLVHEYPDMTVELTLFNAEIESGTIRLLEHNDVRWIRTDEIENYDFCPADKDILKKIKEEF